MRYKKPFPIQRNAAFFQSFCAIGVGLLLACSCVTLFSSHQERQRVFEQWCGFAGEIESYVRSYPCVSGIVIKDLTREYSYGYNEDGKFISASLIKVPIMCAIFRYMHDGELSLDDELVLRRGHKVSGSGTLKYHAAGTKHRIRNLINLMIAKSDNTAARMLTEHIGYRAMNATFVELGLVNTNVTQTSFNMTRRTVKDESYTTPRDIAFLLDAAYHGTLISEEISQDIIETLKLPSRKNRLAVYLPDTFELAHKTGLLRGACHDAGIVYTPSGAYLICVLTQRNHNYRIAKKFISHIGRLTYQFI